MSDGSCEQLTLVFPGALGDFLLALPALRLLRARHRELPASLVVHGALGSLAALTGDWQVASLDDRGASWLFGGGVLPDWLSGRPRVWTWLGGGDPEVRRRLEAVASVVHIHHVERGGRGPHAGVAYVRSVGGSVDRAGLIEAASLLPPPSPRAEGLVEDKSRPVLAIHPGAGARGKRWDPAGFVQVAHWWRRNGGITLEIAGPAEASEVPLLGGGVVRDWDLVDLAALLARAAVFVGNDSGVGHLAAAVGIPGVIVFGPTSPRRWRPISPRLRAVLAARTGDGGIPLAALPATRVIAALRRVFTLTTPDPAISVPA